MELPDLSNWTHDLERLCLDQGFSSVGFVDIAATVDTSEYQEHLDRFRKWISNGQHAEMAYMARGEERRQDPRNLLGSARTLVALTFPYPKQLEQNSAKNPIRYAKYLEGEDYHEKLSEKLEQVLKTLSQNYTFEAQICVDHRAILERTWAYFAGLGWIGKNTLLIHPKLGSFFFLCEILISLAPVKISEPARNICGHCTACIDACPTNALTPENGLNSEKCISYLTLEYRGDFKDPSLNLSSYIAGCDICQDVCPFNRKPILQSDTKSDVSLITDLAELAEETDEHYQRRVQKKALSRIKYPQFKRNLARLNDKN